MGRSLKIDIVIPDESHLDEVINLSFKLGWDKLIVLFRVNDVKDLSIFEDYKKLKENCYLGALIDTMNKKKARKLAVELYYNTRLYNDFIVYAIKGHSLIRYISGLRFFNAILGFEFSQKEDHTHFRKSGINHIIAKNLYSNEIAYLIPISLINEVEDRSKILGRIYQNIRLARKYKFDVIISSFSRYPWEIKTPNAILSFAKVLKLNKPENIISENILKQIQKVRKAKSPWVFTKGFEIIQFPYEDCTEY